MTVVLQVPRNMSYVNALYALWLKSQPARFFEAFPEKQASEEAIFQTAEKIVLFVTETRRSSFYIDYVGGRLIKIEFNNFPHIDHCRYDKVYGLGAAQKALQEYDLVPSSRRFDRNDSHRFSDLTVDVELERQREAERKELHGYRRCHERTFSIAVLSLGVVIMWGIVRVSFFAFDFFKNKLA